MTKQLRAIGGLACVALLLGWSTTYSLVLGADDAPKAKKAPAEPRGWLPMHFTKLVDPLQRDEIYKIQDKYKPQIDELQGKIAAIEAKQNTEIEALLRPDQLAKLKSLRAEAEQARQAKLKDAAAKKAAKGKSKAGDKDAAAQASN